MKKIIRATTIPQSLNPFCRGMLRELSGKYEVIGGHHLAMTYMKSLSVKGFQKNLVSGKDETYYDKIKHCDFWREL